MRITCKDCSSLLFSAAFACNIRCNFLQVCPQFLLLHNPHISRNESLQEEHLHRSPYAFRTHHLINYLCFLPVWSSTIRVAHYPTHRGPIYSPFIATIQIFTLPLIISLGFFASHLLLSKFATHSSCLYVRWAFIIMAFTRYELDLLLNHKQHITRVALYRITGGQAGRQTYGNPSQR